jgi:hypothetical protein
MSADQARRTHGARGGVLLLLMALVVAACSQGTASGSATAPPPIGSAATATPVATSASNVPTAIASATTAPTTAQGTPTSGPTVLASRCAMLDIATIDSITGLTVGAGRETKAGSGSGFSATGGCVWFASSITAVQISSFTEAETKAAIASPLFKATHQAVSGVGLAAMGSAVTSGKVTNVVLYVDFGSFGMEIAVTTPTATLTTAVAVAKALK